MTSWRCLTPLFLCVFLSTILQSEADCLSFDSNDALEYGIKNTSDVKDMMECSARQICRDKNICSVMTACYTTLGSTETNGKVITEECQEASVSHNVSHYDFMCLVATDLGLETPDGFCQYGAVLELLSKLSASKSTTTLPPPTTTTLPTTTTTTLPTTTTTTLPPPTTTTLPERTTTTPTTVLSNAALALVSSSSSSSSSSSTLAPHVTSSPLGGATDRSGKESATLKSFLVISVALNVLLPLLVFLFMRRRHNQNLWEKEDVPGLDPLHGNARGNSAGARDEITSETQPASEKNSPRSTKRSDRESSLELLPNINMSNEAVGEETKA